MTALKKAYPELERKRLSRREREREIGAGGKFKLSLEERVFMTLFFPRHYLTFALLGFLFELHESNAYIWRKVSWNLLAKLVTNFLFPKAKAVRIPLRIVDRLIAHQAATAS